MGHPHEETTMRQISHALFATLATALCLACGGDPDDAFGSMDSDTSQEETPRGPIGKADAVGTCRTATGNLCGGKGSGVCYCDEACKNYGDCCSDYGPVCEGSTPEPSGSSEAISCAEAGDVCSGSPAGAAVYRLYREMLRADKTIDEIDAIRLGAFVRGSGGKNAAVVAFLSKVVASPGTKFSGDGKQLLESFVQGNPPNWVPLENAIYRVERGSTPHFVMDDAIYLTGTGVLSGSTNSTSHSRGYAKKAGGILRFPHGSKAPGHPGVDSPEETQRLRTQGPGLALDVAASTAGLNLGQFGFDYRAQKRFYDPNAQYWEGLCHSWSYGALDERINALVDVEGPASSRGIWIYGQWLSRADLGNWLMAVSDQLSIVDTELVDNFVTPKDVLLGVPQWVMTSGLGLRADMFNDVEKGAMEIWNQPIMAADMKVSGVSSAVRDGVVAFAQTDPKNLQPLPSNPGVKLVEIRVTWGAEINDSHEGAPALQTSDWNMYVVTETDGKAIVAYMAHHLRDGNVAGLPVQNSDPLPDYFAYPKNDLLNAAFEGKGSSLLNGALDGPVFRFFVGTVLAHGVPETMRKSFESDVASGMDVASLKSAYPGIANAYAPAQWDAAFRSKLGSGEEFGARWGKFANPG